MQRRLRLVVALAGTAVPIVLLLMQMAFLNGARIQVTRFYEAFNFDIAIISARTGATFSSVFAPAPSKTFDCVIVRLILDT